MTSSSKNNFLPPSLVANLQDVLSKKNTTTTTDEDPSTSSDDTITQQQNDEDSSKPIVLVTNGDGIDSDGLTAIVGALVKEGLYNVHVCAPMSDRSVSGHSMTPSETLTVNSAEISGATAYEVSGTPADCVSLALSGALFSWSKPALVISGINRGSSCGHHMFYSGTVAGAREALICGVPSISISLNWKKDVSRDSDFKDAVDVCFPLIKAALIDIEKGEFPRSCSLNIEIPTSPLTNKGFKVTKRSLWRTVPSWLAVSANRHPSSGGHFMSNQQSLGIQLAQLGRDASAAGAARRLNTHKKNFEVESVGVAPKTDQKVKKFFRLEFVDKEQEDADEDLDFRALNNGFVAITPSSFSSSNELEIHTSASNWITTALSKDD
ncbi:5'-nucleotidase [Ranunculus cassubicifolius]